MWGLSVAILWKLSTESLSSVVVGVSFRVCNVSTLLEVDCVRSRRYVPGLVILYSGSTCALPLDFFLKQCLACATVFPDDFDS